MLRLRSLRGFALLLRGMPLGFTALVAVGVDVADGPSVVGVTEPAAEAEDT